MKKILFLIFILLIIIFGGWFYFNSKTMSNNLNSETNEISISVKNEGPFKYFQLNTKTTQGVIGQVFLNNEQVASFNGQGTQTISNKAQDLIKDGENKIKIVINPESEELKTGDVQVSLHAMNSEDIATDNNQVLFINWDPSQGNDVSYSFMLRRDSTAPNLAESSGVSDSEKGQVIEAILNKKDILSSKNAARIRSFLTEAPPYKDNSEISSLTDEQIVNYSNILVMELESVTPDILQGANFSKLTADGKSAIVVKFTDSQGKSNELISYSAGGNWY